MTSSATQVIKSVGPKLVPYFKSLAIYFVVFMPHDHPNVLAAILKCLPIISLIIFVVLHSMNLQDEYRWYTKRIIAGLVFSCIGDACLIWPKYFPYGMIAFAIGHINYITAFGFKPLALKTGIILYTLNTACLIYIIPGLDGVLLPGVPAYSYILSTMLWRAAARLFSEDNWTWIKLITMLGALSFVISDGIIALDRFKFKIYYSQVLVMSTYYAAQLGIALSVLDPRLPEGKIVKYKV